MVTERVWPTRWRMRIRSLLPLVVPALLAGCGKDPERLGAMAGKIAARVGSATGALKTRLTAQTLMFPGFIEGLEVGQKVRLRVILDSRLTGCDVHARGMEGDVVELTGSLPSEQLRPLVLQAVESVPGVRGVADGMKVEAKTAP